MQGAPKLFQILILNMIFNFECLKGLDLIFSLGCNP